MGLASWIFGPQLVGVVIFIIGLITLYFPPKHINRFYGYRLPSAMKNQRTWKEANRYSSSFMLKTGLWVFFIGMAVTMVFRILPMEFRIKETLTIFLFMISGIIPGVLSVVATERHLNKTFDKDKK